MMYKEVFKVLGIIAGLAFSAILVLSSQVLFARTLDIKDYGILISLLALITMISSFLPAGLDGFLLRIYGEEGWSAKRWIPSIFKLLFFTTPVFIVLYLTLIFSNKNIQNIQAIHFIPFLFVLSLTQLCRTVWQLEQNYRYVSLSNISPAFIRFSISVFAVVLSLSLNEIGKYFLYFCMVFIAFQISVLYRLYKGGLQLIGHGPADQEFLENGNGHPSVTVKNIIQKTWPYTLLNGFGVVFLQQAVFLLATIGSPEEAAKFGIAFAFISATFIIPSAVCANYLLPKLHRWAQFDEEKLLRVFQVLNGTMLILGLLAGILIYFLVPYLVPMVFGKQYESSILIVKWLSCVVPLRFLATAAGNPLIVGKYVEKRLFSIGCALSINVILNMLLIPKYGAVGAAWSMIIGQLVLLLLYLFFSVQKIFGRRALQNWFSL